MSLSYHGAAYHGWQIQPNAVSVQEKVDYVVSTLLRRPTEVVGSGRTDTGVHARQQVVHFDVPSPLNPSDFAYKANAFLPSDIAVDWVKRVKDGAHARFDAVSRGYEYYLHHSKNPFTEGLSYFFRVPLDMDAVHASLNLLKQWKNFEAFSKVHTDVSNFLCQIHEINWEPTNSGSMFSVSANRFLRGMVRAMVGTLLDIGQKRMTLEQLQEALESKDRSRVGRSVPAHGLYLVKVKYPPEIFLE